MIRIITSFSSCSLSADAAKCSITSAHVGLFNLNVDVSFGLEWLESTSPVSPEGHGEPDRHHHVGGATVLRRENGLKVGPDLQTQRERQDQT